MSSNKSAFGGRANGLRLERIKASPRFDGTVFKNTHGATPGLKPGTVLPTLSEYLCGGQRRTPSGPLPISSPLDRWARPVETGLRATWLGHSTVLVEIDGVRVLTDPVWGERVSPMSFAGPKRFHPAPAPIAALPPLDAVIVSHDHYDHLDHPTILELARLDVPFITSLGVGAHLEAWGVPAQRIIELDWWEHTTLARGGVTITAAPSQHFSGRSLRDRNRTAWSSFQVRGPKHAFFFSGDTGLTPEYAEIRERLGPFDLVMLEVGAYHPAWGDIHLGPENALAAHELLGGGAFLPVHWGTFNLAFHAWDEPPETLLRLASAKGVQLVMPRLGEPVEPSRVERVDPWWRSDAPADAPAPPTPTEPVDPAATSALETAVQWPID
jgi:L-ascorbate metabolism protein UlaG (beta-lactamase superfamily)